MVADLSVLVSDLFIFMRVSCILWRLVFLADLRGLGALNLLLELFHSLLLLWLVEGCHWRVLLDMWFGSGHSGRC